MPWGVPETEIDRLAAQHGLTAVEIGYYDDDGTLVIVYRGKKYRPIEGYGKTDTLPSGLNRPASFLTGDSDPPKASSASDVGPESPSEEPDSAGAGPDVGRVSIPADTGLDDFTAIDGVGPVTAQKLHNLGYYTYDDLRLLPDIIDTPTASISSVRIQQIRRWLDQRLV